MHDLAASAVLARGLLLLAVSLALGCETKAFNTRHVRVSRRWRRRRRPAFRRSGRRGNGRRRQHPVPDRGADRPEAGRSALRLRHRVRHRDLRGRPLLRGRGLCACCGRSGAACEAATECQSGFCADGVCCNVACTGACVSCDQVDQVGVCSPVPAGGEDKHGVCRQDAPDSCGQSGYCNGQGGCAKYVAGTLCKLPTCEGKNEFVPASLCDGEGTCVAGIALTCFPSTCEAGACLSSCTSNDNCMAPNSCQMRELRAQGQRPGLQRRRPVRLRLLRGRRLLRERLRRKVHLLRQPRGAGALSASAGQRRRPAGRPGRARSRQDLRDRGGQHLRHRRSLRRAGRLPELPRRHRLPGRPL